MGLLSKDLISRELEPVLDDTGTWARTNLQVPLTTRRGVGARYSGSVLRPQAGTGSRLQFLCKTTALRPARVRIPICVNAETVVKVFVDDHFTRQVTLKPGAAGSFMLRILAQDVTPWTEAREVAVVQLQFSSGNQSDSPFILLSDEQPQCRPLLLQRRGRRYTWMSALYFFLAWANLLTLSVVALATFETHQEALGNYAVLGTCLVWLAGLLGLPDLARIPVRAWVRRTFAATHPVNSGLLGRRRRQLAMVVLVGVLALSGVPFTQVMSCSWVRHQYTRLIDEAQESSTNVNPAALAALRLAPWRKEAQILVEKAVFAERAGGESFRQVAATLSDDTDVYKVIEQAARLNRPPGYLKAKSPAVGNPVVWYASVIIEGETENDTKQLDKAKSLLQLNADPESQLLLDTLKFAYFPSDGDGDEQEKLVKTLETQLFGPHKPQGYLLSTHAYLFACDSLFHYHLQGCEKDAALKCLEAELSARARADDRTLWLRPPDKFTAFHIFRNYGGMNDPTFTHGNMGTKEAKKLIDACPDFLPDFNQIHAFQTFSTREGWERNTVFAEGFVLRERINNLLAEGWRYLWWPRVRPR